MMPPIKHIGRDPIYFGKTLFEICSKLAQSGEGRVVSRVCAQGDPPGGRHFRLTKCQYDLTPKKQVMWNNRVGIAFGVQLGPNALVEDVVEIEDADLEDWRLVPKVDETKFVEELNKLPKIHPQILIPSPVPPMLQEALKRRR